MKKVLILILLITICLSFVLVGCNSKSKVNDDEYCEISFYDWDGKLIQISRVKKGVDPKIWLDLTRENDGTNTYVFIGWDKDISNPTEDMKVTAVYSETRTYRVLFYIDGAIVKYGYAGASFTAPEPKKEGKVLDGWYENPDFTSKLPSFNSVYYRYIYRDVSLYARFVDESNEPSEEVNPDNGNTPDEQTPNDEQTSTDE